MVFKLSRLVSTTNIPISNIQQIVKQPKTDLISRDKNNYKCLFFFCSPPYTQYHGRRVVIVSLYLLTYNIMGEGWFLYLCTSLHTTSWEKDGSRIFVPPYTQYHRSSVVLLALYLLTHNIIGEGWFLLLVSLYWRT